jgi:glycosyltransferase involved in cell wall biosynthesis
MLARHAQVSLLAFTDHDISSDNLRDIYDQVISVPRAPSYTPAKVARGFLGSTPLPVLNYTTGSMKQSLRQLLSENDFQIVQVESIHLMSYLPILRQARRRPIAICDWHNIESELMQRYSDREPGFLRRAYASKTARLMKAFEERALLEFDAHVTVSERDAERLRHINPKARVFVIENGVDTAFYSDQSDHSKAQRIVFVGSMDYHANIDGAVNFARNVWPAVREQRPGLTFTIVGKDPAAEVRELAQLPSIEVTGTIDDVRPFYREAIAAVVPLNVGGGSRLKILEAMAAGVPVVSTTLGAEGLDVRPDENILIADTNEELAAAIVGLTWNEARRKELSAAGRALVISRYDWVSLGEELFRAYEELVG